MAIFTRLIVQLVITLMFLSLMPCLSFSAVLTVQIKTTPDRGIMPMEVGFETTVTGGSAPYSMTWNFGDGISSTLARPSHMYRESGQYPVWVFVFDRHGNYGVALTTITVAVSSGMSFDPKNAIIQGYSNPNSIRAVMIDRIDLNITWVGTTGGLIRLDRASGKKHIYLSELPDAGVSGLCQSTDGGIWVGTNGGGIARFDYGTNQWQYFNTNNSALPDNSVLSLLQSSDGALWVGTGNMTGNAGKGTGGLARFDYYKNQWQVFNTNNSGLPTNNIRSLIQSSDGFIWIGTDNQGNDAGGLARFDYGKNQWQIFDKNNSPLPYDYLTSLYQAVDGAIWLGTIANGLFRFDYVNNQWQVFNMSNSRMPVTYIKCLTQSSDGAIWMGTGYGNLLRFDYVRNQWQVFNTTNSQLPGSDVTALFQSSAGALWVGTADGLFHFDYAKNQLQIFKTGNSELTEGVPTLAQSTDGAIWIGGTGGILGQSIARFDYSKNQWQVFNINNSELRGDRVDCLLQSFDGAIWMGTTGPLVRFDYAKNQWQVFNASNSPLPDPPNGSWIHSIIQSSDGAIWVGTWVNGLFRFDYAKNQWQVYNISNSGISGDWVECLIQSSDGAIWVGTGNGMGRGIGGLVRFDYAKNQWQVFNTANSQLPGTDVTALFQSSDGAIWVGTGGGSLARFDHSNNRWQVFTKENSPLSSNYYGGILSLIQSSDGAIWVGTRSDGLFRFDYSKNEWFVYKSETTALNSNEIHSLLQTTDGAIWAGGIGLNRITFPTDASSSFGRLILLAGGGSARSNTLWPTTKELALTTYRVFSNRGFANTSIYYISPEKSADFNGDGIDDRVVDCPPSNEDRNAAVADLRYAITDWAVKNYTTGAPLYIYLIDHGWPDDGVHGPYFEVAPGQLLYAKDLNEMISMYEQTTGGKVIVVNESCYSGQFLPFLKKPGRITVAATADKMANYDNWGTNSFTNLFLQKLFENDTLQQAYLKASSALANRALTREQMPQMDDNGDGKSNTTDGIDAASIKLGGDFVMAATWPQIVSIAKGTLTGSSCSFTTTTNIHMRKVWASVQPPNYVPDNGGSYQKIDLETFELTDPGATLSYTGTYQKFAIPGTYILTMYARDQFGNVAVSDPFRVDVGMADKGAITGSVHLQMDNYQVSSGSAGVIARVMETGASTLVDTNGNFSLYGVPAGSYTMRISGPLFSPITISDVIVTPGQTASLSAPVVVKISGSDATTTTPGDATGDNKLGLDDAIYILQKTAGIR